MKLKESNLMTLSDYLKIAEEEFGDGAIAFIKRRIAKFGMGSLVTSSEEDIRIILARQG